LFTLILVITDVAVIATALVGAYFFRFTVLPLPPGIGAPTLEPYLYPLPVVIVLWLVVFKALGLYGRRGRSFGWDTIFALFGGVLLGSVFLGALGFIYRGFSYSRLVLLVAAAFAFVGIGLARAAVVRFRDYLLKRGVGAKRTLVVGTSVAANELSRRLLGGPASDYYFVGVIPSGNSGKNGNGGAVKGCNVLGELEEFFDVVSREKIEVVFFGSDVPDPVLLDLVLECDLKGIDVRILPSTLELMATKVHPDEALGVPVFALKQFRLTGFNRFLKRLMDVVFSASFLIVSAPVWGLAAILVKLTSPGPAFYRQERVGQDGRTFELMKLRSMRHNAEADTGPVFATENDDRVTPLGRFLRRTSLDEIPQFINVLKGDMSVVGPRPERPFFVEKFASTVPRYIERHKVKSGLTGWAQVNGFRGTTSIARRVEYDLYYIENWSLLFDLRILLMTVGQVFGGGGQ
jgi:exopolysaccharide biosynthesis polyprenyl glycosylphosphotransferase